MQPGAADQLSRVRNSPCALSADKKEIVRLDLAWVQGRSVSAEAVQLQQATALVQDHQEAKESEPQL